VYLSNKPNNSDDGNWQHIEYMTRKKNYTKQPRNITIKITNDYFFDFFVKDYHGTQSISKDGIICDDDSKGCGCSSEKCIKRRTKLRIKNFRFDKEDKTLTLDLHADFVYSTTYYFHMNLDSIFKSTLTLKFDITTIWPTVVIQTTMKAKSANITVSELCANVLNSNSNSTEFSINGKNLKNAGDLEINDKDKVGLKSAKLVGTITRIKPNHQINLIFGPKFDYSQTYELKCSKNHSHSKMAFKFEIKKEDMASASLGVGIASTVALIIVGGVIVIAKKMSKKKKKEKEDSLITNLLEEVPMVDLCERKFPQSTVKAWKDITIEKELGSGQFGKVYKGFLHLGPTR
jgi:hypothetical protein